MEVRITDDNGKVIKGWYEDKGRWYHLDEDTGDMKTGWIQLNGIWYYLEPNSNGHQGSCYIDCTTTIDGKEYSFDKDGHMIDNGCVSENLFYFIKAFEGVT